ncbi:MAG: hypothetical protein WA822_12365 [Albidovulum sp.]
MNAQPHPEERIPVLALDALVARYGLFKVTLALSALLARKATRRRLYDSDLSNQMRKDIGLEPLNARAEYWKYLP